MNKEQFLWVLESALLNWDHVDLEVLVTKYNISEKYARIGVKLAKYLKEIKIENE